MSQIVKAATNASGSARRRCEADFTLNICSMHARVCRWSVYMVEMGMRSVRYSGMKKSACF